MLSRACPQAEKALSGASSGFSFFGGRTEKYENAADLYSQAANAFRMQKQSTPNPHAEGHPPVQSPVPNLTVVPNRQGSRSRLRKSRLHPDPEPERAR